MYDHDIPKDVFMRRFAYTQDVQPKLGQDDAKFSLMPFQVDGVNWLCNNWFNRQHCILADEMGLVSSVFMCWESETQSLPCAGQNRSDCLVSRGRDSRRIQGLRIGESTTRSSCGTQLNDHELGARVRALGTTPPCCPVLRRSEISRHYPPV